MSGTGKVLPLNCRDKDMVNTLISFSKDLLKIIVLLKPAFTTAFRSYGAAKYMIKNFNEVKLIFKADHWAGPFNTGMVVVLDSLIDSSEKDLVTCYNRYNSMTWHPKAGFPSTSIQDFSYRVSTVLAVNNVAWYLMRQQSCCPAITTPSPFSFS